MALLDNDAQVSVLVEGLDHPEGIAWGLDGHAYAGGEAGQVYRIDVDAGTATRARQHRRVSSWGWRSTPAATSTPATLGTRP